MLKEEDAVEKLLFKDQCGYMECRVIEILLHKLTCPLELLQSSWQFGREFEV